MVRFRHGHDHDRRRHAHPGRERQRQARARPLAPVPRLAGRAAALRSPSPPTRAASCSSSACSRTAGCRSSSAPSTAAWACGGDGQTLWMTTLYQLWRFENALGAGRAAGRLRPALRAARRLHHRRPRRPRRRGRRRRAAGLRQHAVLLPGHRRARRHSFRPLWRPPFISPPGGGGPLPPERPGARRRRARATSPRSADSDVADGWRDQRRDGGVVIDVAANADRRARPVDAALAALARRAGSGCSIRAPASSATCRPRERARSSRSPSARAICAASRSIGDFAVVGLSQAAREQDLHRPGARRQPAARTRPRPRCGLHGDRPQDRRRGALAAIEGVVDELYDVAVLPGVRAADRARLQDRRDPPRADHRGCGVGPERHAASSINTIRSHPGS